jgi:hypothetical protein
MNIQFNNPFTAPGSWYRGNLHTHTTESDGKVSPGESVKRYTESGYDFLSITDHNKLTLIPSGNLLLIPGEEIDFGFKGYTYHLVALGIREKTGIPAPKRGDISPGKVIKRIKSCGGEAVLAHPYWSNESQKSTELCKGILGLEVYNNCSHVETGNGHAMVHWDDLLRLGWNIYGFAVDDTHSYQSKEFTPDDSLGGWVMVKAEKLSVPAIMSALKHGLFYASSGPEFQSMEIHDNTVFVKTSPVRSITFRTPQWGGRKFEKPDGTMITGAEFIIPAQGMKCFRIECADDRGKMAWLNPVSLSS